MCWFARTPQKESSTDKAHSYFEKLVMNKT